MKAQPHPLPIVIDEEPDEFLSEVGENFQFSTPNNMFENFSVKNLEPHAQVGTKVHNTPQKSSSNARVPSSKPPILTLEKFIEAPKESTVMSFLGLKPSNPSNSAQLYRPQSKNIRNRALEKANMNNLSNLQVPSKESMIIIEDDNEILTGDYIDTNNYISHSKPHIGSLSEILSSIEPAAIKDSFIHPQPKRPVGLEFKMNAEKDLRIAEDKQKGKKITYSKRIKFLHSIGGMSDSGMDLLEELFPSSKSRAQYLKEMNAGPSIGSYNSLNNLPLDRVKDNSLPIVMSKISEIESMLAPFKNMGDNPSPAKSQEQLYEHHFSATLHQMLAVQSAKKKSNPRSKFNKQDLDKIRFLISAEKERAKKAEILRQEQVFEILDDDEVLELSAPKIGDIVNEDTSKVIEKPVSKRVFTSKNAVQTDLKYDLRGIGR